MESLPQKHSARDGMGRGAAPPECKADLPGFRPAEAANDTRMSQLARTIEEEIIPRLMLAHRTATEPMLRPSGRAYAITGDDVRHFAKLVLSHEEDLGFATIQSLRSRQVSVEKIYLDLLAPTARYLGELWDEDLCNFTDVTVGLGRLQRVLRVLRELSPALGRGMEHPAPGRRVLLLPSPGEQHTFGLVMAAEFFRSAGWDVSGGAGPPAPMPPRWWKPNGSTRSAFRSAPRSACRAWPTASRRSGMQHATGTWPCLSVGRCSDCILSSSPRSAQTA